MKLLKLPDIHKLCIGIYMFKIVRLNQCPTLQSNLILDYPSHQHDTRARGDLVLPSTRVDALRINYVYQCKDIWNKIPIEIKSCKTLNAFKKQFTAHLLNRY